KNGSSKWRGGSEEAVWCPSVHTTPWSPCPPATRAFARRWSAREACWGSGQRADNRGRIAEGGQRRGAMKRSVISSPRDRRHADVVRDLVSLGDFLRTART